MSPQDFKRKQHWFHSHLWTHLFFANFEPNSTTFIEPAEIFPERYRSTCHGISAVAGKAGAMIGAFGFWYAAQNQGKSMVDPGYPTGIGMKNALIVLGVINVFGFLLTFLVPGPKGRCLEEISGEKEEVDQAHPAGAEAV